MPDIKWPHASLPLGGGEQVPLLQGGKIKSVSASELASGGVIPPGGVVNVGDYATLRSGQVPTSSAIFLNDPYKGGMFIASPTSLRDDGGTVINDAAGTSWVRVYDGERINAAWFYNGPAGHYLGDGTGVAITSADQTANPQWIGLPGVNGASSGGPYPVGTTWAYVALQEWLYACFAAPGSSPGNVVWNNTSGSASKNRAGWCPAGNMYINQMLMVSASGGNLEFAVKAGSVIIYNGPKTGPLGNRQCAFNFDALSYATVSNLTVFDQVGLPIVVSLDGTHNQGGLVTQQLTLSDWFISGAWGAVPTVGVFVSPSGGAAQGDTIVFMNPIIVNCGTAALALGGQNTLSVSVYEGDIQSCYHDGIASYSGSAFAWGTSFQAAQPDYHDYPQHGPIQLDGADFRIYGGQGGSAFNIMHASRSEDNVFVTDLQRLISVHDSTVSEANFFYWGYQQYQLGQVINGGNVNTAVAMVDDGGPPWFALASGSTASHMIASGSPGWTPNQWVGRPTWYRYSNSWSQQSDSALITSSDANSVSIAPTTFTATFSGQTMTVTSVASGPPLMVWSTAQPTTYATVTGSISGTTLTVTAASGSPIAVGQTVWGASNGTVITAFGTGTGGTGTYTVNNSQSLASTSLTIATQGITIMAFVGGSGGTGTYTVFQSQTVSAPTTFKTPDNFLGGQGATPTTPLNAGYLAKISGNENAGTQPNWDAAPPGSYTGPSASANGWGFSTAAGTNTVSSNNQPPNGNYVLITSVGTPPQGANENFAIPCALIGKVANSNTPGASFTASISGTTMTVTAIASGTIVVGARMDANLPYPTVITNQVSGAAGGIGTYTLAYSYNIASTAGFSTMATFKVVAPDGSPVMAGVSIIDQAGYWGAGIADGQLQWLPLDWNSVYGARLDNCTILGGRGQLLNDSSFIGNPGQSNFWRGDSAATDVSVTTGGRSIVTGTTLYSANGPVTPTYNQMVVTNSITLSVGNAPVSVNLPLMSNVLQQDVTLMAYNQGGASAAINWGANMKAPSASLALGTLGQTTVIRLSWVGSRGILAQAGYWYVTSITGPY